MSVETAWRLTFPTPTGWQCFLAGPGEMLQSIPPTEKTRETGGDREETLEILIVPAAEGLPFTVAVPFDDPVKIRRVLPELLRDIFLGIGPDWRLAWQVKPAAAPGSEGWQVVGLAFPGSVAAEWNLDADRWRLAVPDAFLVPPTAGRGHRRFQAPGSVGLVCFDEGGRLGRVAVDGRGLPLDAIAQAWGGSAGEPWDLARAGSDVARRLAELLAAPGGADLAGWQDRRAAAIRRSAWQAAAAAVVAVVLLFHLIVWLECRTLADRRLSATQAMAKAFNAVFPRDRAVDPVAQTRRFLREAGKPVGGAGEPARLPRLPWVELLRQAAALAPEVVRLEGLTAGPTTWRIKGVVESYRQLTGVVERLRQAWPGSRVRIADSQPEGAGGGSAGAAGRVRFDLEGTWGP